MSGRMIDEDDAVAFICAAKGLPYTHTEWVQRVVQLTEALADARERADRAAVDGVCAPARFDGQ